MALYKYIVRDGQKARPPLSLEQPVAHTTRGARCRQKRRERSYYNLHRQLNKSLFLHFLLI